MKKLEMNDDKIKKYCQSHPMYKTCCYNCKKDIFVLTQNIFVKKENVKTQPCHSCGWLNPIIPQVIYIEEKIDSIEL